MKKFNQGYFESYFEKKQSYINFKTDKVVYGNYKSAFVHKAIFNGKDIDFKVECHDFALKIHKREHEPEVSAILKRFATAYFLGGTKEVLLKKFF